MRAARVEGPAVALAFAVILPQPATKTRVPQPATKARVPHPCRSLTATWVGMYNLTQPALAVASAVADASRYPKASALGLYPVQRERGFSPWGMLCCPLPQKFASKTAPRPSLILAFSHLPPRSIPPRPASRWHDRRHRPTPNRPAGSPTRRSQRRPRQAGLPNRPQALNHSRRKEPHRRPPPLRPRLHPGRTRPDLPRRSYLPPVHRRRPRLLRPPSRPRPPPRPQRQASRRPHRTRQGHHPHYRQSGPQGPRLSSPRPHRPELPPGGRHQRTP